ncbi:MAG: class I SAM-dependent methyltransferase, partial [Mycoplasmataceae bacterium]|nr:class I SAM-dependent methyltransferase [Mycoplasmataceae bacterium]
MSEKWIDTQVRMNIAQFDNAMELYYPESAGYMRDAKKHIVRLCEECNFLDAVKLLDWNVYLKPNATVLDLGCGGGWLTAYLSSFENVENLYAVDSSHYFISEMMPDVVKLMKGSLEKVKSIEGFFSPLLFDDGFLDVVAVSSALHHADNLETVLKEIRRVLKKDGYLVIANETPSSHLRHVYSLTKAFVKILLNMTLAKYKAVSPSISSSGYLNEPYLGD